MEALLTHVIRIRMIIIRNLMLLHEKQVRHYEGSSLPGKDATVTGKELQKFRMRLGAYIFRVIQEE